MNHTIKPKDMNLGMGQIRSGRGADRREGEIDKNRKKRVWKMHYKHA